MPDLSTPELKAMDAYMKSTGVPYKVTSTTGDNHAKNSYHYRGLACDFAAPTPTVDSPGLLAIFNAWTPLESQLAEMIYAGAPYQIKNGKHVPPSLYGSTTMSIHHNHVHVAVRSGWRWTPPLPPLPVVKKVLPMYDPALIVEPVVADLPCPTGGAWCVAASGAIYAWGGAPHFGGANGKDYFKGRKAARLELRESGGYVIVDEQNERYEYSTR